MTGVGIRTQESTTRYRCLHRLREGAILGSYSQIAPGSGHRRPEDSYVAASSTSTRDRSRDRVAGFVARSSPALAAPPNDDFAGAQTLLADAGGLLATNVGADREMGEPDHGNLGGASVWYRWTPVADGVMGIVATGLGEMLIGVYVGDAPGRLVSLESNSGTPAAVAFLATGGTEYHIAVDGFDGLVGPFSLTWGPLPEARELEAREHEADWPSPMVGAQLRALDELEATVRGASARFLFNLRVGNEAIPSPATGACSRRSRRTVTGFGTQQSSASPSLAPQP